ncbi:MAG: ATP-binding protein, partial [Tepidiformaceae bacterium]
DFVYQPMPDDEGAIDRILVHATEVTKQVLARREVESLAKDLEVQRDRLQQVIDVLPMGIAIGDATGAITASNAEARRIWGQEPVEGGVDEYVEYGLWSIDGQPLGPTEIAYSRSLLNGEVIHGEQMLVGNKAEGTRIPLLQNSAPLRDGNGEISGAVVAFTDISRLKALERQKDEFLGLVSHELRTPLTTILGNASILMRHGTRLTPDQVASAHRDIQSDAQRLQQIVENMLALSRVESQRDPELEPVLLGRLIGTAIEDHRRRFPSRELRFEAEPSAAVVEALPSYVLQVIGNLLSNAEKYSPANQPIDVTISLEDGMAVTRVLDRGKGLTDAEAGLIFDSFYRSGEPAQRPPGLGLGLAVCKRLMEAQNGDIWCSRRPGGGSEFAFNLPVSLE